MDRTGQLRLKLLSVGDEPLGETVDVSLRNQTLSDSRVASIDASKTTTIKDLVGAPQGLYRVEVDPPSYMPVAQFINLKADGPTDLTITCPVDPQKVKDVKFPAFDDLARELRTFLEQSDQVLSFEGKKGKDLYDAFDNIRRAGLMNLFTKAANTILTNGKTVFPYIQTLTELRGDRFFAKVPKELREETKNSVAEGLFHPVDESLHHPPDGFAHAGSFKTPDHYGNLQLTFFANGDDWRLDMDIDDAQGFEHIFQVLRNALQNRPTHPYDIHEILIEYQRLDPGYQLIV